MRKLNTGFFQKDGYFNIFSIVEPWFDKLFMMSIFNFYAFRIELKDSLCMAILDDRVLEFFEFIKKMMLILIVALINNDNYTKICHRINNFRGVLMEYNLPSKHCSIHPACPEYGFST